MNDVAACAAFSMPHGSLANAAPLDVRYLDIKSSSQGALMNKTDVIILPQPIQKTTMTPTCCGG